ncbi:MAG: MTH1187 family thiamine-binding protein [Peptococcaceae bacterium]|nr:MTH1187 family thiamine-binding protein [Peptococcaceae bacterium]
MAVVEVSVIPIGTPSTSLSEYVAGCVKVLREAGGITYQLTPMATVIEGELERVLEVVRRMHEQPFVRGAGRVVTTIRIDDRRDRELTMAGKVAAVEAKLDS